MPHTSIDDVEAFGADDHSLDNAENKMEMPPLSFLIVVS